MATLRGAKRICDVARAWYSHFPLHVIDSIMRIAFVCKSRGDVCDELFLVCRIPHILDNHLTAQRQ